MITLLEILCILRHLEDLFAKRDSKKLDVCCDYHRFIPIFCRQLHVFQFLGIVTDYTAVVFQDIPAAQDFFKDPGVLFYDGRIGNDVNNTFQIMLSCMLQGKCQ